MVAPLEPGALGLEGRRILVTGAAQGLGRETAVWLSRLGAEVIAADIAPCDATLARCRSLRSRRVAIKPWSRATWREMARRLSRNVSGQLAPDLARAFRNAGRGAREQSGGALKRALDWMRGSRKRADEEPAEE